MTAPISLDLIGSHVRLRVMGEADAPALVRAASDGELWNLVVTVVPSEATVAAYMKPALDGFRAGTVIPYVIESVATGEAIGSTRFWKLDLVNRTVEIGHTWISASYQRTVINTEMKLLMLAYAFETLNCVRVQFQTDELNTKSRAAIARLGAKEEGILRNERIMPDGRIRNTVMFSILDSEWPDVKSKLAARLAGEAASGNVATGALSVVPAKAGTQSQEWIPAFAGMTGRESASIQLDQILECRNSEMFRMTERMFHRTKLSVAALLLFGPCACAQAASFFVDPSHYDLYNCDQLNTAHKTVGKRVAELKGLMAKAETGFAGALMSGLAYQSEFVAARGELEQIEEDRRKLNCGPLPLEKPEPALAPEPKQKHRKKH